MFSLPNVRTLNVLTNYRMNRGKKLYATTTFFFSGDFFIIKLDFSFLRNREILYCIQNILDNTFDSLALDKLTSFLDIFIYRMVSFLGIHLFYYLKLFLVREKQFNL